MARLSKERRTKLLEVCAAAHPGPWSIGPYALDIFGPGKHGPTKLFDVRGWGYYTGKGHGALGLTDEEGKKRQEDNCQFVVDAHADFSNALHDLADANEEIIELKAALAEAQKGIELMMDVAEPHWRGAGVKPSAEWAILEFMASYNENQTRAEDAEAALAERWLSPSTAPKDGTVILGVFEEGCRVVRWDKSSIFGEFWFAPAGGAGGGQMFREEIRGWMPLPREKDLRGEIIEGETS